MDFGDSDIPFLPRELQELQARHKTFQYLPTVAGATGIMYNLRTPSGKLIKNLRLDSRALTGIFTGTITQWNSPIIMSQNPQLRGQIPARGSSRWCAPTARAPRRCSRTICASCSPPCGNRSARDHGISPCGQISFWPLDIAGAVGQKGSDGVANYVQQQTSTITYVETGYALGSQLPGGAGQEPSGRYVFPSSAADAPRSPMRASGLT